MGLSNFDIAAVAAIAMIGGLVRGITGFGGAMAIAPLASLILGPTPAVVMALALETAAAATMMPNALQHMKWRTIAPISLMAFVTIPVGGWVLVSLDPVLLRRFIAALVVVFVAAMALGLRYRGPQRLATSMALGGVSGVLYAATSMGAPPVILYLLAGSDPIATTRANLVVFVSLISGVSLVVLAAGGVVSAQAAAWALAMAPIYLGATWVGGLVFRRWGERNFRTWVFVLLLAMSLPVLLL